MECISVFKPLHFALRGPVVLFFVGGATTSVYGALCATSMVLVWDAATPSVLFATVSRVSPKIFAVRYVLNFRLVLNVGAVVFMIRGVLLVRV